MGKDEIHTIDKATFKGIFFQMNLPQIFEFDDHFEIRSKYKIQYSKRELAGETELFFLGVMIADKKGKKYYSEQIPEEMPKKGEKIVARSFNGVKTSDFFQCYFDLIFFDWTRKVFIEVRYYLEKKYLIQLIHVKKDSMSRVKINEMKNLMKSKVIKDIVGKTEESNPKKYLRYRIVSTIIRFNYLNIYLPLTENVCF